MRIKLVESHTESEVVLPTPHSSKEIARLKLWAELPPLHQDISHIKYRSQGDLVFCLPIFEYAQRYPDQQNYPARVGYMKRVFWLVYELLRFTDTQDTGTGIYIVCEDVIRESIEPYRQLCNFPEELILTVPADALGYLKKIAFLNQLAKRTDFKYYMSLDLAITFYNRVSFCQEFLDSWAKSDVDAIFHGKKGLWDLADKPISFRKGSTVTYKFAGSDKKIPPERFYRELPKFFGYDTYEDYLRQVSIPEIPFPGWLYGLSKKHILSRAFQEFFDFATGNGNINDSRLCSDEAFLVLYWHKYLSPERRFIAIPKILRDHFCWNPDFQRQFGAVCRIYHEEDDDNEFHEFYEHYYQNLNK